MEYCLIEKWGSGCVLPEGSKAVALTPIASYQLDKAGISYVTFGDYFSSGQIRGDTDSYLKSQVLWFKEFDEFVMKLFPEAKEFKLKLPSLYFHNIKYMVDCVILSSRILNRFIEITKPSKIWFLPEIYGEDKVGCWIYFTFGASSFFRLAPLICRRENIPFEQLKFKQSDTVSAQNGYRKRVNLSFKATFLMKLRAIKKKFLRCACLFYGFNLVYRKNATNTFIVKELRYTGYFYKDAKRAGFNIYYKNGDCVYKLNWFQLRFKINFADIENAVLEKEIDFKLAADNLVNGKIMKWVNEQCGLDVSFMLYPTFKFFLEEVFVETIVRIKKYVQFYDKYKIDFVISYLLSTVDDFAAVAAARIAKATKSVSFFHGVDALEFKSRYFSEYCHFDYFFVSTAGEAENIKSLANLFHDKMIKVSEYSYLRDDLLLKHKVASNKSLARSAKPLVLYIPIMRVERMNMPIEKAQSLQWDYFKWHKALIKYFSSRKDFHFVWKSLLLYFDRGDTIADMIKDAKSSNITYSMESLREWFPKADRVICDIPSTAFYECIFNKIPVLSLYRPDDQKLHSDAYRSCGLSLQPYFTVEEGISVIEKYLDSKVDNYIVSLPSSNVFIPEVLLSTKS